MKYTWVTSRQVQMTKLQTAVGIIFKSTNSGKMMKEGEVKFLFLTVTLMFTRMTIVKLLSAVVLR